MHTKSLLQMYSKFLYLSVSCTLFICPFPLQACSSLISFLQCKSLEDLLKFLRFKRVFFYVKPGLALVVCIGSLSGSALIS